MVETATDVRNISRIAFSTYEQNPVANLNPDAGGRPVCETDPIVRDIGFANATRLVIWEIKEYWAIGIRGTVLSCKDNVATDLYFSQEQLHECLWRDSEQGKERPHVHAGFQEAYVKARPEIRTELSRIGLVRWNDDQDSGGNFQADKPIIVTGHSLGGALAVLLALDLTLNSKRR